jgi:hypothetical protein
MLRLRVFIEEKSIQVEFLNLNVSTSNHLLDGTKVEFLSIWGDDHFFNFFIFILLEVHENWSSWGSEGKLDGVGEGEVDSDDVTEVDVVEMGLSQGEDSVDGAEGAGDVESPGGELHLVLWIVELDSVLVDELTEEITGDLEVLGEALWSNLLWPELSTDLLELFSDKIQDLLPSGLVGGVLHDVRDESVLSSKVSSHVGDDVVDGGMLIVLLEKGLEAKTELEEVGSHHTSLIGKVFAGVWVFAVLVYLSAEHVESGRFDSGEVLEVWNWRHLAVRLNVGEHFLS